MNKRMFGFAMLLPLFSLGLVACGSAASGSQSESDGNQTFTLTIGMEAAYPPFNWTEKTSDPTHNILIKGKTGEYAAGYDFQIASYVAKDNGWNLEVVAMGWDNLIPALGSGTINAICAGMSATAERRQSIDFTDPYYESKLVLITRKSDTRFSAESNFDFKANLKGVKLITQAGTFEDDLAHDWAEQYGATYLSATTDYPTAFLQVSQGAADAVICELPVARSTASANQDLQITPLDNTQIDATYVDQTKIAMGIAKNDPLGIEKKINASLSKLDDTTRNAWMDEAIARSAAND